MLSQRVTSFGVRTGAGLSTVCMQRARSDIPPIDSELHLDSPTMAGWRQSGLFKHVKAEEPLRESNKACLRAEGRFIRISRGFSACLRGKAFMSFILSYIMTWFEARVWCKL